jgi:hypothetical protein
MKVNFWKPAEVNILLTAIELKGKDKGAEIAAKRLKRTKASCMQKYYTASKKLVVAKKPQVKKSAPKLPAVAKTPSTGMSIMTGKLVAKGESLLVVKSDNKYIMINT